MFSLLLTSLSSFAGCNGDGKETEALSDTATESEIVSSTETETKTEIESPSINETDKSTETESESKEDISETSAQTESDTVTESAAMTESSSESGSSSESSSASETDETCETEIDLDSIVYENGKEINQAGYSWDDDAFVLTDRAVDTSKAKDVTAGELKLLLSDRDAERNGEVYRLVEPLRLDPDTKYYGNSAAIIATKGVIIENADNVVLK